MSFTISWFLEILQVNKLTVCILLLATPWHYFCEVLKSGLFSDFPDPPGKNKEEFLSY